MKNARNSSFELLRLLCIFGIITMHTFATIDTGASTLNTAIHVLVNSLFNTGVTCFILISGYFGIRFDLKKLISLDFMIIFFTLAGTILLGDFGIKSLIKSCIPVLSRQYWFITCYFALCILAPFLNQIPERLSREHFRNLILVLLLIFSVIPTLTTYDIMQDAGKGLVDFVMIYLLGRYLSLYHKEKSYHSSRLALGILLSTVIVFGLDLILTLKQGVIYSTCSRDCSIFIIFSSVLILLLFSQMHFTSRFINRAASNVLAVYVLDQTLRTLLNRYIDLNAYATKPYLILIVLGYVAVVVLAALLINEIRRLTIGRIEPWASGLLAGLWYRLQDVLVKLVQRISGFFLKG